jgi:hypothetical protein
VSIGIAQSYQTFNFNLSRHTIHAYIISGAFVTQTPNSNYFFFLITEIYRLIAIMTRWAALPNFLTVVTRDCVLIQVPDSPPR